MKKEGFYERHKVACILWSLFALSVIIRAIIAGFPKHILVMYDELYYYSYAENLAKGRGFPVIYQFYDNLQNRFLYSILISPAFLISNRIIQFRLIALINSLILSSGIFPTYLLARDVIESKKWGLICSLLFVFLPDMVYSISFMADIPMLPLGLWMIYLIYLILDIDKSASRIRNIALFCVLQFVILWSKKSGLLFSLVLFCGLILYYLIPSIKEKTITKRNIVIVIILLVSSLCALFAVVHFMGFDQIVKEEIIAIFHNFKIKGLEFVKYYCYFITQILLAIGIFPLIVSYIYLFRYDKKGKRLLFIMTLTSFFLTLLVNRISLNYNDIGRIHLRYLIFIWMPYMILFCKVVSDINFKPGLKEWFLWGICFIGILAIIRYYHGPHKASDIEYTMLYWVEDWQNNHLFYVIGIVVLMISVIVLAYRNYNYTLAYLVLGIWLVIQLYNNVKATNRYRELYRTDMREVAEVESVIKNHPDKTFAIINAGKSVRDYEHAELFNYMSTKMSDTYLNYDNVLRVSLSDIIEIEKESEKGVYYIPDHPIRVDFKSWEKYYDTEKVDYVVVPKDSGSTLDMEMCEKIEINEESIYDIYKLKDSKTIPHIKSVRYIQEGKYIIPVNDYMFLSRYEKDGEYLYESTSEKNDFVLYGPYISLSPGKYKVTVHYTYSGTELGKEIGFADINGYGLDCEKFKTPIISDETEVSVDFSTEDELNQFEVRACAEKEGLKMSYVEICYEH